jgi:hypothetical protein
MMDEPRPVWVPIGPWISLRKTMVQPTLIGLCDNRPSLPAKQRCGNKSLSGHASLVPLILPGSDRLHNFARHFFSPDIPGLGNESHGLGSWEFCQQIDDWSFIPNFLHMILSTGQEVSEDLAL